ncbi:MAG: Gfo/Idh/MocA family oxidoreductase [Sphaerochaetaceae bacterium]|nr:Gfo/Idh/MocA family oxidoreductase [Sphaerochaetaceae bacterium]
MKNGKLGIGLIGLGVIAPTHASAICETDCAYLAAVTTSDREKQKLWSEKYSCRAYDNLEEMLEDEEVDAVAITTPSGTHREIALKAIKAKKHVLVEKPLEITVDRCLDMIRAAEENHVVLATVFQSRFMDSTKIIKEAVQKGRFGKLTLADASFKWYRSQAYYDSAAWRGTWNLDGGGVFMNQGIHAVDALLYLAGEDPEVKSSFTACLAHEDIEVEDAGAAILCFPSGAMGVIEGSTAAYPGSRKRVEIRGTKGSAVWEDEFITMWEFTDPAPEDEEIRKRFAPPAGDNSSKGNGQRPHYHAHSRCYVDFVNAIKTGKKPLIDGQEGLRSVKLVTDIYKRAKEESCT